MQSLRQDRIRRQTPGDSILSSLTASHLQQQSRAPRTTRARAADLAKDTRSLARLQMTASLCTITLLELPVHISIVSSTIGPHSLFQTSPWVKESSKILHYLSFFPLKTAVYEGWWQEWPLTTNANLSPGARKLHHFPQHHELQLRVQVPMGKHLHANICLLPIPTSESQLTWNGPLRSLMKRDETELQEKLASTDVLPTFQLSRGVRGHQGQKGLSLSQALA